MDQNDIRTGKLSPTGKKHECAVKAVGDENSGSTDVAGVSNQAEKLKAFSF